MKNYISKDNMIGIIMMLTSSVLFQLFLMVPKYIGKHFVIHDTEIGFLGVLFANILSWGLLLFNKSFHKPNTQRTYSIKFGQKFWWAVMIISSAMPPFLIMAIVRIPMQNFTVISFLLPIVLVVFEIIFSKEKLTRYNTSALLLGFVGILILSNFIWSSFNIGYIFAVLYVTTYALQSFATRALALHHRIIVLNVIFQLFLLTGQFLWAFPTWVQPSVSVLILSLISGFLGMMSAWTFMMAMAHGKLKIVMLFNYFMLPIGFVLEYMFFEKPFWNFMFILGTAIIIASSILTTLKPKDITTP